MEIYQNNGSFVNRTFSNNGQVFPSISAVLLFKFEYELFFVQIYKSVLFLKSKSNFKLFSNIFCVSRKHIYDLLIKVVMIWFEPLYLVSNFSYLCFRNFIRLFNSSTVFLFELFQNKFFEKVFFLWTANEIKLSHNLQNLYQILREISPFGLYLVLLIEKKFT